MEDADYLAHNALKRFPSSILYFNLISSFLWRECGSRTCASDELREAFYIVFHCTPSYCSELRTFQNSFFARSLKNWSPMRHATFKFPPPTLAYATSPSSATLRSPNRACLNNIASMVAMSSPAYSDILCLEVTPRSLPEGSLYDSHRVLMTSPPHPTLRALGRPSAHHMLERRFLLTSHAFQGVREVADEISAWGQ